MSDEIFTIITKGAKYLNIKLPPGTEAAFRAYHDFLEERGQNVNLTAIAGVKKVACLHFLDSLALLNAADFYKTKVIDIGSGAGFPGVPLKIAEPSIALTLLDATGKRIKFLKELCTKLGVDVTCVNSRAEEAAHLPEFRGQYNIVVSRAVARLNILCELCLPFIQIGGKFIAMKSIDSAGEVNEAQFAINTLGAEIEKQYDYTLPDTDVTHRAIIIGKTKETPDKYPRRFAKIQKSPL